MLYYLSSYLFLILYIIFSISDILDEKIFLNSQGKKLNQKINLQNNFNIKFSMLNISYLLIIVLINILLTIKYINYNFIYIKVFNKTFDFVSTYSLNVTYIYIIYIFLNFASVFLKFLKKNQKKSRFYKKMSKIKSIYPNKVIKKPKNLLNLNGLYQNVLITGSIGSGKTYGAINSFTNFFIKNNISGLILDIKGNYINSLNEIKEKNNSNVNIVEISLINNIKYNPLEKNYMNEYELASFIRNTLEILSEINTNDSYWLDKIENVLHVFIIILKLSNKKINFLNIHEFITDNSKLNDTISKLKEDFLNNKFSKEEIYKLNYAIEFLNTEYISLDDRVMSIIKSEITRITIPFVSDYYVKEKFCTETNINFNNKNQIIILNMNVGTNKSLTKILSAFLKSDFQKFILKNINSDPHFFLCDEYQEFALKQDAEFLALSREYKCISVLAMQSYTSLKNKLKCEEATKLVIQNCVNKIWFRQDDMYTIDHILKQLGKILKRRKTHTIGENAKTTIYNKFTDKFTNYNSNISESYSYSYVLEEKYNHNFFTNKLKTLEALILYSDGEKIKIFKKNFKEGGDIFEESNSNINNYNDN